MTGQRSLSSGVAALVAALMAAIGLALAGCSSGTTAKATAVSDGSGTVSRVVDGDTIVVRLAGHDEKVRLIGIDTPETVKPNTPVQCFGREASNRTKALLPAGTAVRVVRDAELRDDYGRLLAYVYRVSDGLFVNLALVRDGFAVPYRFPPNVAHAIEITGAAQDAKAVGKGLWSACPVAAIPHHAGGP